MTNRFNSMRPMCKPFSIIGGVVMAAVLAFLFGLFIMLLWNWLMPALFDLGTITYWQGWGIAVLAHLLFKAGSGHHFKEDRRRRDPFWKKEFKEKVEDSFDSCGNAGDEDWSGGWGIRDEIRNKIRSEIKKEFEKEWEKEREKENRKREPESGSDTSGTEPDQNDTD